jgi:hypothetical protein
VAFNATYTRHWFNNTIVGVNTLVGPNDYDPYCITAPTDPRLPTSGQRICGFYDIKPASFGQQDIVVKGSSSSNVGKWSEVYQGVDLSLNVRLANTLVLQGGTSTGRVVSDNCDVVQRTGLNTAGGTNLAYPIVAGFGNYVTGGLVGPAQYGCRVVPPWQTQVKGLAVYTLPWNIQVSGSIQSVPGNQVLANYVATTAEVAPSLGRPLAGSVRTVTLPLLAPMTQFTDRLNQIDFRVARTFRIGGTRLQPQLDLYNAFNRSPVLAVNNTYGTNGVTWLQPTSILSGRLLKLGAQIDF